VCVLFILFFCSYQAKNSFPFSVFLPWGAGGGTLSKITGTDQEAKDQDELTG